METIFAIYCAIYALAFINPVAALYAGAIFYAALVVGLTIYGSYRRGA
jgi:hypothetical protein